MTTETLAAIFSDLAEAIFDHADSVDEARELFAVRTEVIGNNEPTVEGEILETWTFTDGSRVLVGHWDGTISMIEEFAD